MNHIYHLVWSATHGALIAVSEASRAHGKTGGRSSKVASAVASTLLALSGASATLGALPAYAADELVSSETYTVLNYGDLGSFTNSSVIMSTENAVNISGEVSGGIINSGVISSYGDGVHVSGNLLGGFANLSNGLLQTRLRSVVVGGNLVGDFTNEGQINSGKSVLTVSGMMTGNITNTNTGKAYSNNSFAILGTGLRGNFTNDGDIYAFNSILFRIDDGGMVGHFLNTGRMSTSSIGVAIDGDLIGNISNYGTIVTPYEESFTIRGNMEGNFLNTSTGQISADYVLKAGDFKGDITNEGGLLATTIFDFGYASFIGNFIGNFSNTATGRIFAETYVLDAENFNGDLFNAGLMQAGGDVIKLYGAMNGNFTNASSGLLLSGRNGISIGGDLVGDINNAGSIIGGRYENFRRYWSNGQQYYVSYPSFTNVYVPEVISQNPPSGIHVNGNLNGNFINSGSIRAPQAVFINGDLIGDYSNTGIIEGGYVGLTTSANGGLSGNRSLTGNSVVIAGNFEGNFTTSVGQGILVGDYVHDWTPPTSYDLQAENLIIGLREGTGTVDLRSKTVSVHVNQAIEDGYTWTAIDSADLLYNENFVITDNSVLYDFDYNIVEDDLVITTVLRGATQTPVTSSSEYNGVSYTSPNGFTVAAGTTILNDGIAVHVSGDVNGSIVNSGEIISTNEQAVFFNGNLNGNFDNALTGKIYTVDSKDAFVIAGNVTGNITNSGEITAGYTGFNIGGSVTGSITNNQSGLIYANDIALEISGNIEGDIINHGLMTSLEDDAIYIRGAMNGNFLNSASAGIYSDYDSLEISGPLDGNITNAGEMASAEGSVFYLNQLMTGNFLNTADGHIWSLGSSVLLEGGLDGNFTNQGQIVSGGRGVYVQDNLTGDFLNSRGATISSDDEGVKLNDISGNFTNNGKILSTTDLGVVITTANGDVINGENGEIRAMDDAVQIRSLNGNFTNDGLITSNGYVTEVDPSYWDYDVNTDGVYIDLPLIITNRGAGVSVNPYDQIWRNGGYVDDLSSLPNLMVGNFTNSATGRIIGYASGVSIRGGLEGDLNNQGLIKANAGDAVKLGGTLTGTISNSGTLEATDGAGIHVTSTVTGGEINNSGTIDATDDASGNTGAGSGIYVADGSALTSITNASTGYIRGSVKAIHLANASNSLTVNNSGVLEGDVYLGTAGNVLNIEGDVARIIGNVANNGASSTVNVNGTFTSEGTFDVGLFNVNDGGLFNMNHSITATTTTVNNGGTLNVGTGDRNIVGDYLQQSGGTLRFSLTDPSTYGSLNVSGNATVSDGAEIDVVLNGTPASRIDGLLVAEGTLTANPANIVVTDNSAFYNFTASTTRDNQEIDLISEINQNAFTEGGTRPTIGIARSMQYMLNNGVPEPLQPAFDVLDKMNPSQINNALLQMTPALQGATTQAVVNSLRNVNKVIQSRYESVHGLSSGDASHEQAAWFKTFGNRGDQGNANTVPGFDSRSHGLVFGMDKLITDQTRAGGLFTYARTDIDSNVGNAKVNIDSYKIAAYASYSIDPKTDINFQMDYGVHRADSARSISFMGTRAKADFDGTDWHIAAGIGHVIDLSEKSSITPSLRLDYTHFRTDSYTEKGAGALNNHVKSAVYEEFVLDMGAKFTHQLNDNGLKFVANGSLAYDFINETAQATSNLIGGGPSFVTKGLDPSPWLYRGGLGLVKAADSGLEVSARYDVEGRSSDYINQTASVNLRWSF